jgi:hypothetical protein
MEDQRTDDESDSGHKQSRYKRDLGPTGKANWPNRGRLLRSFSSLELLRDLWIAKIIFVDVKEVQAQAVLHLALAQIVQVRLPVPVLGQIFRHMPRQKNMPGIAAIEHPLRDIDSRSYKVRFVVNIGDSVDRATVDPHPHLNVRMILQGPANLESTSHRFFRAVEEKERHPVSRRHSDKFTGCFRRSKTFGVSHDLIQFLEKFNLLVHQQYRITYYVD